MTQDTNPFYLLILKTKKTSNNELCTNYPFNFSLPIMFKTLFYTNQYLASDARCECRYT
jgi:hypothetical protein